MDEAELDYWFLVSFTICITLHLPTICLSILTLRNQNS